MKTTMKTGRLFASLFAALMIAGLTGCSKKPDMPVAVTFREAAIGKSLVAQIHSNFGKAVKVLVDVHSRTTGRSKETELLIGAGDVIELGWLEGWALVPGETICIHHADYRNLTVTVP